QRRLFCCGVWAIWININKLVHEEKKSLGKEIAARLGATVKINFDVAFDGSNAKSASGVVVRNASGDILTLKITFHESFPPEFATEALACFKGILLGAQLGFESVTVEGDSMTTIKKSKLNTPEKPMIGAIVRDIQ
ncbi:hypothetical protein Goari_021352, partial [Gossypium aridum]|nr:hypothetical protein [Gossypium aridum]